MGHMMDTDLDPTQMLEVRMISFLRICTFYYLPFSGRVIP